MEEDFKLVITEDRLNDLDLETFYFVNKNADAALDFVAHFMVDAKGQYLDKLTAIRLLVKGRKVSDIREIAEKIQEEMELAMVPKE